MEADDPDDVSQLALPWVFGRDLRVEDLMAHAVSGSCWRVRTPGGTLGQLRWDGEARGWVHIPLTGGAQVLGPQVHRLFLCNAQFLPVDEDGEVVR